VIKKKLISSDFPTRPHWLDYAEAECDAKLVAETKTVLKILKIFLILPLYAATYSQNSSRFVLQAARMDGDLGFYTIKPDQMVMSVTIFILLMVPVFDYVVYPVLSMFGIKKPLHKIACGFVTATISLTLAAVVEWKLEENSLSILWLLPQYFFIAISDVFVWVSTVNFAYTQAPERMKSVMSAFVYLANAGGSIIVIVVSSTNFMGSQMNEFLMFCGAMVVNIGIFLVLSRNHKGVKKN
jgi:proton-dependent oligopeptide transporter, POT family